MTKKYQAKDVLLGLGKARIKAYKDKLQKDADYYEAEEKYKTLKADIMMGAGVSGLGSRELREAQAELFIAQDPNYRDYLEKKMYSKKAYETQMMIETLISIAKTLANNSMLDEDAGVLLEEVENA